MSAHAWVRRQRDRPIAEQQRHAAMAAIVVLLASVALLLTITQPAAAPSSQGTLTRRALRAEAPTGRLASQARSTARRFLAGYLAYAYGQSPASQITGATRPLILSLQSGPPRSAPAIRARHPHIVSLNATSAAAGRVTLSATVNDGGLIDYTVGLLLTRDRGRLLVSALEESR